MKQRAIERPFMRAAHELVCKAVRLGLLEHPRDRICVDCGAEASRYDHRYYSRPLEVDPVCVGCNVKRGPAWDSDMLAADVAIPDDFQVAPRLIGRPKGSRNRVHLIAISA